MQPSPELDLRIYPKRESRIHIHGPQTNLVDFPNWAVSSPRFVLRNINITPYVTLTQYLHKYIA